MILSELIPFLKRIDTRPKKSLSQNFLVDPNIVRKIVQTAEIIPGDQVLEIGPGPGALTHELLKAGAQVTAIELDPIFAQELPRLQTPDQRLTVHNEDVLRFPLTNLPAPLKIVANLPYHITTPILEKVFAHPFLSLTIMIQKEVADRMAAPAGSKTFGSLSLFTQFYSTPHSSFLVPASCFYPCPKVDSTVIRLDHRIPPPVDTPSFFALVHKAFQQRRKMISTSLSTLYKSDQIKSILNSLSLNPNARPEDLSLEEWLAFHKSFLTLS